MPRKAFVTDLQEATRIFERVNVSHLRAGEEDGMINFHYHMNDGDATEITVMVPGKWPLRLSRPGGTINRCFNTQDVIMKPFEGVH